MLIEHHKTTRNTIKMTSGCPSDLAMELVLEASKRQERSGKLDPEQGSSQMRAHPVWLYSADSSDMAREVEHRTMNLGSCPTPCRRGSSADRPAAGPASSVP